MTATMKHRYALVPLRLMERFQIKTDPDSFISQEVGDEEVDALLDQGYLWVRTEGGFALLELVLDPSAVVLDALQISKP